ncbi:hypothetical protein IE4872_PD01301 (plasmid) [Rhizobium gallicum]|uniref:Uncharacterized protein n=1 Tax=Rhizobium gallicum TaxID=56730 RepID=A0A1L5NVB9_9HYPH|nr:hypothetical protein IE4872_PD01301 [Rhizobium gallicum]
MRHRLPAAVAWLLDAQRLRMAMSFEGVKRESRDLQRSDAALHVADPFAVFGARNADFGTFPADMLVVLRADDIKDSNIDNR